MLVKSFLAIPHSDKIHHLARFINSLDNCEATCPQSQENVLVVVMENDNQTSEDQTLFKLRQNTSLDHIVLVSSFNEKS